MELPFRDLPLEARISSEGRLLKSAQLRPWGRATSLSFAQPKEIGEGFYELDVWLLDADGARVLDGEVCIELSCHGGESDRVFLPSPEGQLTTRAGLARVLARALDLPIEGEPPTLRAETTDGALQGDELALDTLGQGLNLSMDDQSQA